MSEIRVKSTFGAVDIDGLFSRNALAELFVGMYADPDVRELLNDALATRRSVNDEGGDARLARTRYDRALDALADVVALPVVHVDPDSARQLRDRLIGARLGQGRATASVYGRYARRSA